jgi:mono/diheme cytochrome c family protein
MKWPWAILVLAAWHTCALAGADLTILDGDTRREYSQSQLLSRPDVETITVGDSVYHERVVHFKAVPIAHLFQGLALPAGAVINCTGTDGFSALLQKTRLFDADPAASHAYLAIEDPADPWPVLAGQSTSAGPFYVVWTHPQASAIGREEWPFRVASFTVIADDRSVFAHSYPAADAGRAVMSGFESYRKNCLACHRMNGDGDGTMGPDLNRPSNPTTYLQPGTLRALIRDPASVRTWPGMVMRGFSVAAISDTELTDLLEYLKYMRGREDPG